MDIARPGLTSAPPSTSPAPLAVTIPEDEVEAAHDRDHVRHQDALHQLFERLEIAKRRRPDLHPVWLVSAIRNQVEAELAARAFDEGVDIADRTLEAFTDEPEMVDDRLHALAELGTRRQGDLAVGSEPGAVRQVIDRLLQDSQALAHLRHPHPVPVVAISVRSDRHLEVVLLVAAVRKCLANVVIDAGRT